MNKKEKTKYHGKSCKCSCPRCGVSGVTGSCWCGCNECTSNKYGYKSNLTHSMNEKEELAEVIYFALTHWDTNLMTKGFAKELAKQILEKVIKPKEEEWTFKLITVLNNLSDNDGKLDCYDKDILSQLSTKNK